MHDETPLQATKYGMVLPISTARLAEELPYADAIRNYAEATPEQRQQRAREAAEQRAAERADTPTVALTMERLTAALGISRPLAHHLVQPYCYCDIGSDGWDYCAHAYDERIPS